MRAILQRVKEARVEINGVAVGQTAKGLLILIGAGKEDTEKDIDYLVEKIAGLRIFEDDAEKMNLSITDVGGEILIVSQFTLYGDCRKGRRPSFDDAAPPDVAEKLYNLFVQRMKEKGLKVETGRFRAMMDVHLVNSGPVTILLDSKKIF